MKRQLFTGTALLLLPASAWAHAGHVRLSSLAEAVGYYFTSAELLATLAVAILAGQNGGAAVRASLAAFPVGVLAGLGGALAVGFEPPAARAAALSLLGLGALAAWSPRWPPTACAALAAAAALVHAWLLMTVARESAAIAVAGMLLTAMALLALVAHWVSRMRAEWALITMRVAGSWVAAVGLLMLGRSLSGA